ncbi:hypothetical protein D3C81_1737310 [compost metagenome]
MEVPTIPTHETTKNNGSKMEKRLPFIIIAISRANEAHRATPNPKRSNAISLIRPAKRPVIWLAIMIPTPFIAKIML